MKTNVISHKGKRETNQDFVLVETLDTEKYLYLVVDGMGGYNYGAEAAKMVTESVSTYLRTVKVLNDVEVQMAINKANLSIRQFSEDKESKLGATVGGILIENKSAFCFWVGDVKIFHFRNNKLVYESQAHTLINQIIENGSITETDRLLKYKHVVTHSIQGDLEHSKMDYKRIDDLMEGDLLMICSDGVHDIYEGIAIQQVLNSSENTEEALERIENRLIKDAKDNFSFVSNKI